MPWANGRGVTAEICAWPPAPHEWAWRLSIADVADDGPFSVMPGVDRHIMVVDGVGMGLTVDASPELRVAFGAGPLSFSGDAVTSCRLLDGPISDLNLMVRRDIGEGALLLERVRSGHRLNAADAVGSHHRVVAVVALHGHVRANSVDLAPFDALLFDTDELMPTLVARSASSVAIATFSEMSRA
jgi:environmental stress-induced protein Ves